MKTPLYERHLQAGAHMAEFWGWQMPMFYGKGAIYEHLAVRRSLGLIDLCHMGCIQVDGPDSEQLLEYLSTNYIASRPVGSVTYTVWANTAGGCIDDLLIFRAGKEKFLLIANPMNREKVERHVKEYGQEMDVNVYAQNSTGMLSLQGPHAPMVLAVLFPESARLAYMHFLQARYAGCEVILSRTGYTGSVGFDILAPHEILAQLWDELLKEGAAYGIEPVGQAALDTLRLETGYAHYGEELTETVAPTETCSAFAVKWAKPDFLGKEALELTQSDPGKRRQYGVILAKRNIARTGCEVRLAGDVIGSVTSGNYSPLLNASIALIMVDRELAIGAKVQIEARLQSVEAQVVELPFVPIECKQIAKVVRDRQFWLRGVKTVYFAAARQFEKNLQMILKRLSIIWDIKSLVNMQLMAMKRK